jgi:hypothetical protein
MKLRWRFGIAAGIVLVVCALYPQLKMSYLRGKDWQGSYAYNDIDEAAYASYIAALIDGRPRKNDPYTGRDDSAENPQPESLFSIQFAAAYAVAVPARVLGISASTAMTTAGAIAAFLAALACFWLIGKITGDSWFAMAGTLVILCGGALAAGEGALGELLGTGISYPYFPFLRRYVPAVPFPVFFAMCGAVWMLVTAQDIRKRILYTVLASICFAFLVFSYFYIWTVAAAWLFAVAVLWIIARPADWQRDVKAFLSLGAACGLALIPYAYLLSNRSQSMDDVQLLVFSRAPDLERVPEYISLCVLVLLGLGVFTKRIGLREPSTLFAAAFAVVPILVFNQQIVTGRSLQPIHYQVFIGNYVAAAALVLAGGAFWTKFASNKPLIARSALAAVAVAAAAWGIVECHYTVRILDEANVARDEMIPVERRLRELSATDNGAVYPLSLLQGDESPTWAPQPMLWARHQHVFAGITWQENKERYYQWLYYMGLDEIWLENTLRHGDIVSTIALFGWGRQTQRLSIGAKPLTYGEIADEARRFAAYRSSFSVVQATSPQLSYVVIPEGWTLDFSTLDRWYQRDEGEHSGKYIIYRVKLRGS